GNATGSAWNGTNGSFLGTTTTQPLVLATTNTTTRQPILFWAGNQQVLQLNPAGTTAPAWSIQRDAGGNTRGLYAVDLQVSRGSVSQVASGNNSVICGGSNNTASGVMSVIGGGEQNSAIGSTSTVSGGAYNVAQGGYSTVGGGYTNTAGSTGATVGGGTSNTAGGQYSTIGGGQSNTISPGEYSTISGGQNNTITGDYSAIAGGYNLRLGGRSFGFSGQSSTTQTNLSTNSNIAAFVDVDLWLYNRSNTARQLRFYVPTTDATGNAFYTAFRASSTQTGTITYTLPPSLTSTTNVANGYLQTDANGNLSWINPLTAVTTFAWSLTGNSATNPSTNFLGTTDNQPLVIRTNNVERLRVLSSGNVGIGTSTPLSALDIAGGIAIGTYAGSNAAPSNGLIVSGNAGIGIASPQVRLHVDGGTGNATYLKITNGTTSGTGSSSGFNVGLTTNASAELRLYNNSSMSFFTNNNEWIRLLNTGDLRVFGLAGTSGGHYFSIENNNGVASQMRLEVPDNNATLGSYTAFQAGNHAGRNYIYTLPIDTPAVGHVLKVISVTPSGSNFFVSLAWDTTQGTAISPVNRAAGTGFAPYVAYWVNDSTIAPADYAYWDAINKRVGLGNFTISNPPQYMLHLRGSSAVGSGDLFIQKDGGTGARLYFGTPNLGNNWTAFRAGNQSVNLDYTLPTVGPTNSGNGTNRFALATDNGNSTSPTLQWTTFWSPSGNAGVSTGFIGTTDANDLRFRTNNTQRMIISATGNVGIATSSPAATLDVNGTASVSGSVSIGGNLTVSGTTITFPSIPSSSTASELMVWNAGSLERRSAAGLVSGIAWSLTGNSSTNPTTNFLGTTDNQPLVIRTNNQERIRVMPNGDIGIGTSTPTQRLHIQNGSIHLQHDENSQWSAALHFRKSRGTESTPTIVQNGDEAGYLYFRGYDGSAYQPAALILSNIDGTPGSNSMPGRLSFLTTPVGSATPVERVRITSAGNVGIGTTTPTTRLHVASSSDPLRLEGVQSDNTQTNVLVIDSDGIVKRRSLTSFPGTTTYIRKTSNQSVTNSTTYQNDNALFYSATANQVFEFEAYMFISGGSGGIKIRVTIPSGASMKLYAELKKDDQHHWVYNKLTSSTDEVSWNDINNSYGYARIVGIIQMGSSGGNVQVQWAQNSSNATATTVESGSYLKITPVQ
ncbi:MAG: hypothetical protein RML15_09205, partial [Bacteroidota bacterium]|nr:hypothetical protein [Bacteroidota bacterium]